jgi:hypothetical protein
MNNKVIKKVNKGINLNDNYIRLHLTFTSRVIAGWAITLVGLIKLWQTNDPASWWPILMGGTGIMIVSRGVDHYMDNQKQEYTETIDLEKAKVESPYAHATMDESMVFNEVNEVPAVKKHKEYQSKLPV